jgi:hypothetical protein
MHFGIVWLMCIIINHEIFTVIFICYLLISVKQLFLLGVSYSVNNKLELLSPCQQRNVTKET